MIVDILNGVIIAIVIGVIVGLLSGTVAMIILNKRMNKVRFMEEDESHAEDES